MKRFLLTLPVLLITSPAFAEGRGYDEGGCTDQQAGNFFSMIGYLIVALVILAVVGFIYDTYKMKTDPAYRARAEQFRREYDEKRRRENRGW